MLLAIGILLIFLGLVTVLFGDKDVGLKGGIILKMFSWPRGSAKFTKVAIGAALIYGGVMIVLHEIGK